MALPLAGPQALLRSLNARAILDALARRGSLTKAELMAATGLSRTAVTQVLRMLESAGAVHIAGVDRATKGPAATRFSLDPDLGFAVAVHGGRESVHVALIDVRGVIRAERSARHAHPEDRAEQIADLVDQCRSDVPGELLHAIVGIPGIIAGGTTLRDDQGPDGGVFHAELTRRLGCPVTLDNDINLAALAELAGPAGHGLTDFVLLSIGDAIGSAIVIDSRLHRGVGGGAGELGFLPQPSVPIGTPVLSVEVYADFARDAGRDPALPLPAHLDAAATGDVAALRMVEMIAERIHVLAATVTLTIDPQAILLTGYGAHPVLVDAVQDRAARFAHLLPMAFRLSRGGTEATLTGAAREACTALRAALFERILGLTAERSRR
ncbi:ROK family transcriptional regulator [Microbacterium sp. NIBRBAC000506063]|uniref:ROK family transcriptional regulator n=1 Tax=Microbacterium sp. NIBRBAC000506063 TaxID=2734618 RepID=UPI001BB7DFD2|nr:ROK family transcriptional regulator [Microbacterium sp. NIBRBAC000506063]QTV79117.1 ROK family transcriptional regulator [Microbacterium sp. NIBRBAC000506063]